MIINTCGSTKPLVTTLSKTGIQIIVPPNSEFNHLDIFGLPGGVSGKNSFNVNTCTHGYYISQSGSITKDLNNPSMYTTLISVTSGKTYTFSGVCGLVGNKRIHGYDSSGSWVKQLGYVNQNTLSLGDEFEASVVIPTTVSYVRLSCSEPDENLQFEIGSTKTSYEIYGILNLNIDSFSGTNKAKIPLNIYPRSLDTSGYEPNFLSIDSQGHVGITVYSELSYEYYELSDCNLPEIEARDRIYLDVADHPTVEYTYTIDGLISVVPDGILDVNESGIYDVTDYKFVSVSI